MEAVFKTWYKTFEFIRKGKRPVQLKTRRRSRIEVLQFRKTALEYLKKKNNSVA